MADTDITLTTLVLGKSPEIREAAIAARLVGAAAAGKRIAVILEGLPSGGVALLAVESLPTLPKSDRLLASVQVVRIAAGCPCCSGNLVMRVTLNRILQKPPTRLYIGLANNSHLQKFRDFLTQTPYSALLHLTDDINPQE